MSLYKEQRQQIRESILNTSLELFRDKGYASVSVEEITKRVGIAKGTFYNFFKTKHEILMHWALKQFEELDIKRAMDNGRTMQQNMDTFISALSSAIEREEALFKGFLAEVNKQEKIPEQGDGFDFLKLYEVVWRNSSDFTAIGEKDLSIKLHVINSALFFGVVKWFDRSNNSEGLEPYLKKIVQICLEGVLKNSK